MDAVTVAAWVLRGAVAVIFLVMGVNHFRPRTARAMARIVPPCLRREGTLKPINLVYFTGACELLGGVGILTPWTRLAAAIALTVFLVAVFPANAYASQHPEKFGRAAIPFWPRLIAQLALIALVLLAGLLA
ncbi:MAG TPA: DoxX family membrane protein [Galbitalea sp.]